MGIVIFLSWEYEMLKYKKMESVINEKQFYHNNGILKHFFIIIWEQSKKFTIEFKSVVIDKNILNQWYIQENKT